MNHVFGEYWCLLCVYDHTWKFEDLISYVQLPRAFFHCLFTSLVVISQSYVVSHSGILALLSKPNFTNCLCGTSLYVLVCNQVWFINVVETWRKLYFNDMSVDPTRCFLCISVYWEAPAGRLMAHLMTSNSWDVIPTAGKQWIQG